MKKKSPELSKWPVKSQNFPYIYFLLHCDRALHWVTAPPGTCRLLINVNISIHPANLFLFFLLLLCMLHWQVGRLCTLGCIQFDNFSYGMYWKFAQNQIDVNSKLSKLKWWFSFSLCTFYRNKERSEKQDFYWCPQIN